MRCGRYLITILSIAAITGCSSGTKETPPAETPAPAAQAEPSAASPTAETLTGEFAMGDATTRYEAQVSRIGEVHRIREASDFGDYGSSQTEYEFRAGTLAEMERKELRRATDPARGGAMDTVATGVAFDAAGAVRAGERRVNGVTANLSEQDARGFLRQAYALCARVADQWTATRFVEARGLAGEYAASLPAASSPGREITLTLGSDHVARMSADYKNGEPPILQEGIWYGRGPARAFVRLYWIDDRPTRSSPLVFELDGEMLRATEYDRAEYGSVGLQFARTMAYGVIPAEIAGIEWRWMEYRSNGEGAEDNSITVDDPAMYTLTVAPDGKFALRADCNRGSGSFRAAGTSGVTLGPLALTRAMCPPGSLSDRYVQLLEAAVSYFVRDGSLYLELPADGGTLRFEGRR